MLSFCAQSQGEVAESIIQRITFTLRERGGLSQMVGEDQESVFPSTPHPPWRAPSPQGEGFPSLFETVDSATSGRDALRAE